MDEQKLKDASSFFYSLIINNQKRLQYGATERERIKQQIENNQNPTGYRAVWLRQSSAKVVRLLYELSKEFNEIYQFDKASAVDLIDILVTTKKRIENHIEKSEESDQNKE